MGCINSSAKIYTENPNNDTQLTVAFAITAETIQKAYDDGYNDALSIFGKNQSYNEHLNLQDYYNDGYLAGYSTENAEKIFGFDKQSLLEFYNPYYGIDEINGIYGYELLCKVN